MPKWIGNRIGVGVTFVGDTDASPAIYNLFDQYYGKRIGGWVNPSGLTATGGVISDYVDGSDVYRAHIFTSSGTFDVSSPGTFGDTVESLVVAGGGGGGDHNSPGHGGNGGGGAGGLVEGTALPVSTSPGSYAITVGAGGVSYGNPIGFTAPARSGANSTISNPNITTLIAEGGGGGGLDFDDTVSPGGSGGGGAGSHGPAGSATQPGTNSLYGATDYGFGGGTGSIPAPYAAGGGGGAGGAGSPNPSTSISGNGGAGRANVYAYGPANPVTYAGGGGGGAAGPGAGGGGGGTPGTGGTGGGGPNPLGVAGLYSTGGGGGGVRETNAVNESGGSGIVVVRYQIGQLTAAAKATGGAISYYGGKTIHTFTGSGTFATAPNWTSATVEYVVIGGGGSGGLKYYISGGGGAGAYRTGTTPIGAHPVSTTIQVGAGGVVGTASAPTGGGADGTPSYFGIPITAPGGGGGGTYPNPGTGRAGGSGGGGAGASTPGGGGPATGSPFPGLIQATPSSGWGHAGGDSNTSAPAYGGGGGGGAGGNGGNGSPNAAGVGGAGIQLPSTFRNPASTVGAPGPTSAPTPNGFDTSGKYWVAGGGAGSAYPTGTTPGSGGGPGGPYAGGGAGGAGNNGGDAGTNTGGGGGGQEREPGPASQAGRGGSGIVIIAYPS